MAKNVGRHKKFKEKKIKMVIGNFRFGNSLKYSSLTSHSFQTTFFDEA